MRYLGKICKMLPPPTYITPPGKMCSQLRCMPPDVYNMPLEEKHEFLRRYNNPSEGDGIYIFQPYEETRE